MEIPSLFHDGRAPDFRRRFGFELERATRVDVAVKRMRLGTIDLSEREVAGLERVRLLLAELRAPALDAEAHALMARRDARVRLARLQRLLELDVVAVRVAPLAGWSPDFSVFSDASGPRGLLLGFHAFESPHPWPGPALGAHFGAVEAREALTRFDEAWRRGHDVVPAIRSVFRRAARWPVTSPGAAERPNPVDTISALG